MSPKERRAYRLGFLRAMRKARRELDEMGRRLDDELAGLEDRMRAAREQTAQWLDDELNGVRAEMQAARAEFHRYRAVEHAIDVERDPNTLLN
jgi:uncharacterized membrane-anchored protein